MRPDVKRAMWICASGVAIILVGGFVLLSCQATADATRSLSAVTAASKITIERYNRGRRVVVRPLAVAGAGQPTDDTLLRNAIVAWAKDAAQGDGFGIDYNSYAPDLMIVLDVGDVTFSGNLVVCVGKDGTGKPFQVSRQSTSQDKALSALIVKTLPAK